MVVNKKIITKNLWQDYRNFTSRYSLKEISIGNDKLSYIDSETKNKPVLLMLHGTRGNPFIFWNQFNQLGKKIRLISIHLPLEHDARQISESILRLMEKLSIKKFNLLGTSIGGYLAQFFAYYYPEFVKKLFICNSIVDGRGIDNPSYFVSKYILPKVPYSFIKKKFSKGIIENHNLYFDLETFIFQNIISGLSSKELSERALSFYVNGAVPDLKLPKQKIVIIDTKDDPYVSLTPRKRVLDKYRDVIHYEFDRGHHFPYIVQAEKFNNLLLKEIL